MFLSGKKRRKFRIQLKHELQLQQLPQLLLQLQHQQQQQNLLLLVLFFFQIKRE